MKKLHFAIMIHAPVQRVWETVTGKETYPKWTEPFNPGSYYQGDWSEGSKMLFLGPDPKTGKEGGMVSRIAENRPYEFLSIEHIGLMSDGVEDMTSEEVKKWTPAFENYTFKEMNGDTEFLVDIDVADEYEQTFTEMWPNALEKLKELCEA